MFPAAVPPAPTVVTVCSADSSQHPLAVYDPASTAPRHFAVNLGPGDCYTGVKITLRSPAPYRVDAHAPDGAAWTGNVARSKHRPAGTYKVAKHRNGGTILVRVY